MLQPGGGDCVGAAEGRVFNGRQGITKVLRIMTSVRGRWKSKLQGEEGLSQIRQINIGRRY